MVRRLSELYERDELVEIKFGEELWLAARVVGFQHPGLWVATADGAPWFVTNGRRIRKTARDQDLTSKS